MNCKVIAIANQKGGVGKTITTVNLGVGLVKEEKSIFLHDGKGKVAEAYRNLAKEVLDDGRQKQRIKNSTEFVR